MIKYYLFGIILLSSQISYGQQIMTPELLWKLGRVHGGGISKDGKYVIYTVSTPDVTQNKSISKTYSIPLTGGDAKEIINRDSVLYNKNISPDGKYILYDKDVKLKSVKGVDFYPDLPKSNVFIYTDLDYRHWDKWRDGKFNHVFLAPANNPTGAKDLMPGETFDSPQKPFGGDEDYVWSPDSKNVVYVAKKKSGKEYALSTNTDLYQYNIAG